mgnify:CR=1 FL=1
MIWLLAWTLLATPPATHRDVIEVTTGLGGLFWESAGRNQIDSSNGTAISYRHHIQGRLWGGGTLLLNAFSGDPEFAQGPGLAQVDAMLYWRTPMDDWTLLLGGGVALSLVTSYRTLSEETDGQPAGHYSIWMPGIQLGGHAMVQMHIHPRLDLGLSLRYYSGLYKERCWEGQATVCQGTDMWMQNWFLGFSLSFHLR